MDDDDWCPDEGAQAPPASESAPKRVTQQIVLGFHPPPVNAVQVEDVEQGLVDDAPPLGEMDDDDFRVGMSAKRHRAYIEL